MSSNRNPNLHAADPAVVAIKVDNLRGSHPESVLAWLSLFLDDLRALRCNNHTMAITASVNLGPRERQNMREYVKLSNCALADIAIVNEATNDTDAWDAQWSSAQIGKLAVLEARLLRVKTYLKANIWEFEIQLEGYWFRQKI